MQCFIFISLHLAVFVLFRYFFAMLSFHFVSFRKCFFSIFPFLSFQFFFWFLCYCSPRRVLLKFYYSCIIARLFDVTHCCDSRYFIDKSNARFQTFLLVYTNKSGTLPVRTLPSVFGVSCTAGTSSTCFTCCSTLMKLITLLFPLCTHYRKFLLCTCFCNIRDNHLDICVTGELRSVMNLRLDDNGHSSYQKILMLLSCILHTLSKFDHIPVAFVTTPHLRLCCFICGRRSVAFARYRMICIVPEGRFLHYRKVLYYYFVMYISVTAALYFKCNN